MYRELKKMHSNTSNSRFLGIVLPTCGNLFCMGFAKNGKCYGVLQDDISFLVETKRRESSNRKKVIEMGKFKTEDMDNGKEFLGGMTQKEFYDRLHFLREHGGHK